MVEQVSVLHVLRYDMTFCIKYKICSRVSLPHWELYTKGNSIEMVEQNSLVQAS